MEEAELPLPGRCTDIVIQKKKKDKVSLFVGGSFLGGFYSDVIEKAGITRGDEITFERYRELNRLNRQYQLHEQICRWLAVRDHGSGEIVRKSLAKGYTTEEASRALSPFIEKGYLDDMSFAETFARVKKGRHGWGPGKIRQALAQKGVKKQYIDSALEGSFTEAQLADALIAAARSAARRLLRTEPGLKRKKKLVDFLIRRGFPGHTVMEKCDELLKKLENEEL
jgi:regulatory protein